MGATRAGSTVFSLTNALRRGCAVSIITSKNQPNPTACHNLVPCHTTTGPPAEQQQHVTLNQQYGDVILGTHATAMAMVMTMDGDDDDDADDDDDVLTTTDETYRSVPSLPCKED